MSEETPLTVLEILRPLTNSYVCNKLHLFITKDEVEFFKALLGNKKLSYEFRFRLYSLIRIEYHPFKNNCCPPEILEMHMEIKIKEIDLRLKNDGWILE